MVKEAIAPTASPSLADAMEALARAVSDVRAASAGSTSADALITTLRLADELHTAAIGMTAQLARTGEIERATGLPAEMALRLDARRTRWDARELTAAADALAHMPETAAALSDGAISWSQTRAILRTARELDADARTTVDRLIGAQARALIDAEPEELIDRVEDAAARSRADRALHREDRSVERSFLWLQPRLGGGGSLYGEVDTESFATIAGALDAAAERPSGGDGGSRARQHIDALVAICETSLAGGTAGTRPRPRLIATVDLAELANLGVSEGARVLAAVIGRAPRLTPLATRVLACDAEIVPVLFDGGRPIAVGDAATPISAKMRTAIVARDLGCRFPGCGAPASWCDVHPRLNRSLQHLPEDDQGQREVGAWHQGGEGIERATTSSRKGSGARSSAVRLEASSSATSPPRWRCLLRS